MQNQNNFEGDNTQRQFHAYYSTTTPQFWNVSTFYILRPAVIDDRALRGGPAIRSATNHFAELDVTSDSRSQLIGNGGIGVYRDEKGGRQANVYLNATYRPVSNVSVMFGPSFSTGNAYAQYVQAVSDTTATSFYGTRYVVSSLDQRTLGLDTRLSVTFSPNMTLELYTQPFFAAGRYYDFKEYAAPRSFETLVYGRDRGSIVATKDKDGMVTKYTVDPDGAGPAQAFAISNPNFSSQSLRGNAVFRWEYRPGSVLYVAWTQSRSADAGFGTLALVRDRDALLAARPDNIFLVKASWWLTR
jgi:hypothetical protein